VPCLDLGCCRCHCCRSGARGPPLNGGLIKKIRSGGDYICARKNYAGEQDFQLGCGLFFFVNDFRPLQPTDTWEKARVIKCPRKFVSREEFEANDDPDKWGITDDIIKEWVQSREFCDAFILDLLDAFQDVVPPPPALMVTWRDELLEQEDELAPLLKIFEITKDRSDFVTLAELKAEIIRCELPLSAPKVQDDLIRRGCFKPPNAITVRSAAPGSPGQQARVLQGIRRRADSDDADE
jgi:hypothetical protein